VHFIEDAFIDLAFEVGGIEGLTAREVKQYIRYIADRRLMQLGLKEIYLVDNNPLPWLDEILKLVWNIQISLKSCYRIYKSCNNRFMG
jgi:ribonucleoside-diphosphate reductase beta chain